MINSISKKLYFIFIILKLCNPGLDVFVVRIPPKEEKFTLVITMPGHQKRKFSFDQKLLELTIKMNKNNLEIGKVLQKDQEHLKRR